MYQPHFILHPKRIACDKSLIFYTRHDWQIKNHSLFWQDMNGEWHIIHSIQYLFHIIMKLYNNHIILFLLIFFVVFLKKVNSTRVHICTRAHARERTPKHTYTKIWKNIRLCWKFVYKSFARRWLRIWPLILVIRDRGFILAIEYVTFWIELRAMTRAPSFFVYDISLSPRSVAPFILLNKCSARGIGCSSMIIFGFHVGL